MAQTPFERERGEERQLNNQHGRRIKVLEQKNMLYFK